MMYLRSGMRVASLSVVAAASLVACSGGGGSPGDDQDGGAGGSAGGSASSMVPYRNYLVDKVDLLFMIDNSASMADKQKILAAAVPDLVERLTNPVCVDRTSREFVGSVYPGESCANSFPGSEREFEPIEDIHIGIITSSLGGHGADSCSDVPTQAWNPRQEDMSHLVTRGRDEAGSEVTVETYDGKGFLNWDPLGRSTPPGESNIHSLKANFTYLVRGADQDGCGFEASLEAWYRFLVDPAPYERMVPVPCFEGDSENKCRGPEGVDHVVLQQRVDFLRKDSLLAVVMLTDENDCSVIDDRQYYLALQGIDGTSAFHVARGTDACQSDPWSADCKSCWEVDPSKFPECNTGWQNPDRDDPLNLRCWDQKRRFGIDFLYPVRRYVDGLTKQRLDDGTLNPLFCSETTDDTRTKCARLLRDPSLVFLAGIVGVPWQDIAVDPSDLAKGYLPAERLSWTPEIFVNRGEQPPPGLPEGKTLWNLVLGEVDENPGTDVDGDGVIDGDEKNPRYGSIVPTVEPLDPLMRESVDPRSGVHPATGASLVPPGSGNPVGHPVNGSEWTVEARNDLQYACVFELGQFGPVDCSLAENMYGCDCGYGPENPLCWDGSSYGNMQFRAKAYPGRRQLAVLKGLGNQAVVASVCPANMTDTTASDFGYRPAIAAIVRRLESAFQTSCWDQELAMAVDGSVACTVLEATRGTADGSGNVVCPPCSGPRRDPTAAQLDALRRDPTASANELVCACQLLQVPPGPDLEACVRASFVTDVEGWCYVDPGQDLSHNADIVASCPADKKRLIRFVGDNIPAPGSLTFVDCER